MLGAIGGDIIGSVYEARPTKSTAFQLFSSGSRFTDDSVLTVAVAEVLLDAGDYAEAYRRYYRTYPDAGYGATFQQWASGAVDGPYGSFGNGSAMRVSPVGWLLSSLEDVLEEAARSASVTHDHPEGIKGAQATASAIYLARTGANIDGIRAFITEEFGYDLARTPDQIRPAYGFDVTCQGSVPESIICALTSRSYEDAIRLAVSLGGDADTMGAIAGSIAEALHGGVPDVIREQILARLDVPMAEVLERFYALVG